MDDLKEIFKEISSFRSDQLFVTQKEEAAANCRPLFFEL